MHKTLLLLVLITLVASKQLCQCKQLNADSTVATPPTTTATTTAPPQNGRSFFLFGAIFRKFRQRWAAQHDPGVPLFAGPAYPLYGYQNCPVYGCNPALNYRPAPYKSPSIYYHPPAPLPPPPAYPPSPLYPAPAPPLQQQQQQQQQQMHQQSNVAIYQRDPGHQGYYGQSLSPPPPPQLPPPAPQAPLYTPPTYNRQPGSTLPAGNPQYPFVDAPPCQTQYYPCNTGY